MAACGLGDVRVSLFENSWVTPDDMIIESAIFKSLVSCLGRDAPGYATLF